MSNQLLFTILMFAVAIGIAIVASMIRKRKAEQRTAELARAAQMLGWSYSPGVVKPWPINVEAADLFQHGHSRNIRNFMSNEMDGVKISMFDYEFTEGSGKHAHHHSQSVICIEDQRINLPNFSLRPENYWHKLISLVGYQDIDITNREGFSNMYLLRGKDEGPVRTLFRPELLTFLESNMGTCTDGSGNRMFIFVKDRKIPPHEVQGFLDWGRRLHALFPRRF